MAANSMSSLTSLSFNLLFGFIPRPPQNKSLKTDKHCIIVLHDAIEKGYLFSLYPAPLPG